jgi:putative toxin-antitoxin system antitoxin component (TIGR02293 family)
MYGYPMNQLSLKKSAFDQITEAASANALAESFVLPADVITEFERDGIKPQEIDKIIGPRDELLRLVDGHEKLSPEQTDRAARLANIVRLAEHIFGKREKAFLWLRCPNPELGNRQPLECLVRESAARAVEEALLRIDHGIIG